MESKRRLEKGALRFCFCRTWNICAECYWGGVLYPTGTVKWPRVSTFHLRSDDIEMQFCPSMCILMDYS